MERLPASKVDTSLLPPGFRGVAAVLLVALPYIVYVIAKAPGQRAVLAGIGVITLLAALAMVLVKPAGSRRRPRSGPPKPAEPGPPPGVEPASSLLYSVSMFNAMVECLSDVSAQRTRDLLERSRALAGSDEERSVLTNCINILDQALAARRRRPQ